MEIGVVQRTEVGKNMDGETDVLLVTADATEDDDIQTLELFQNGMDYVPLQGARVWIDWLPEGDAYRIITAIQDFQVSTVEPGERRVYALNDDNEKTAQIYYKKTGELGLNEGEDFVVRYSELKLAFDELKADFNALVDMVSGHIHATTATVGASATPGVISAPTSPASKSSADMSKSKVETVMIPTFEQEEEED